MAKRTLSPLPEPRLTGRKLPLTLLKSRWCRAHGRQFSPFYFGKQGISRWDDPSRRAFGVLYAGSDGAIAFLETIVHDGLSKSLIDKNDFACMSLSIFASNRALNLVDLAASGLASLGVDARLCNSDDYAISRRWSAAFHAHASKPDGILYRSRRDPSKLCVAISDRAKKVLKIES